MSDYQHMDHAAWLERHNVATNRQNAASRGKRKNLPALPEKLTDFQIRVVDILGMVGGGIYNAPIAWNTVNWQYGFNGVSVVWKFPQFATWDRCDLTMLVFLCHEARIRCEIGPGGPRGLRLSFWPRKANGEIGRRHPNLDEAVALFRAYLPADHRIIYRELAAPEEPA